MAHHVLQNHGWPLTQAVRWDTRWTPITPSSIARTSSPTGRIQLTGIEFMKPNVLGQNWNQTTIAPGQREWCPTTWRLYLQVRLHAYEELTRSSTWLLHLRWGVVPPHNLGNNKILLENVDVARFPAKPCQVLGRDLARGKS